jgi:hypothetical protein
MSAPALNSIPVDWDTGTMTTNVFSQDKSCCPRVPPISAGLGVRV